MNNRWLALAGLVAAVLVTAACGGSSPGSSNAARSSPSASDATLTSAKIGGVRVLTNAKGFTLYWFVPDTPTTSKCNGTCAMYRPPVK